MVRYTWQQVSEDGTLFDVTRGLYASGQEAFDAVEMDEQLRVEVRNGYTTFRLGAQLWHLTIIDGSKGPLDA